VTHRSCYRVRDAACWQKRNSNDGGSYHHQHNTTDRDTISDDPAIWIKHVCNILSQFPL
jgi:hypothetical protein